MDQQLESLFSLVINGDELVTKKLNEAGYNARAINKFIEDRVLIRVKRGNYKIICFDKLYSYANYLIRNKEYEKAKIIFLECLKIKPGNGSILFRLFVTEVKTQNFEKAFSYFEILFSQGKELYKNDYNLYLFLLNSVYDIPQKFSGYLKDLEFADLMIKTSDKRFKYRNELNDIIGLIYNRSFYLAHTLLCKMKKEGKIPVVYGVLLNKLLSTIIEKNKLSRKNLSDLAEKRNYSQVVELLKNKPFKELLPYERCTLMLCRDIISLLNGKKITLSKSDASLGLMRVIYDRDYKLALEMNNSYKESTSVEINSLLNRLLMVVYGLVEKQNINEAYNSLIYYLINSDLLNASSSLKAFLELTNNTIYEKLIMCLIKLDFIKKDYDYYRTIQVLETLKNGDFNFDTSKYISEFYLALFHFDFTWAEVCLECLKEADKYANIGCSICDFENDLKERKKEKEEEKIKDLNIEDVSTKRLDVNYDEHEPSSIERYIKNSSDRVRTLRDTILVLKPLSTEEARKALCLLQDEKDIYVNCEMIDNSKRLVLHYRLQERVNRQEVKDKIFELYRSKNYEECILQINIFVRTMPKLSGYYLKLLSMCFIFLGYRNLAIQYLDIVSSISYGSIKDDSVNLLARLKREKVSDEEMQQNDSGNCEGNDIEDILILVLNENLSVDEACRRYGKNEMQTAVIKLIFAREYYALGVFDEGDQLIKDVEKVEGKTKLIKELLEEIRANRNFYKHRADSGDAPFVRLLKPINS